MKSVDTASLWIRRQIQFLEYTLSCSLLKNFLYTALTCICSLPKYVAQVYHTEHTCSEAKSAHACYYPFHMEPLTCIRSYRSKLHLTQVVTLTQVTSRVTSYRMAEHRPTWSDTRLKLHWQSVQTMQPGKYTHVGFLCLAQPVLCCMRTVYMQRNTAALVNQHVQPGSMRFPWPMESNNSSSMARKLLNTTCTGDSQIIRVSLTGH